MSGLEIGLLGMLSFVIGWLLAENHRLNRRRR